MKKTVCVDLDATLARYDGWRGPDHFGDPLPGAAEFTRALAEFADVVIYTTRCSEEMGRGVGAALLARGVRQWLDRHGITYHHVWTGQGKPIYAALVDDRAVPCRPQEDPAAYATALDACRRLTGAA